MSRVIRKPLFVIPLVVRVGRVTNPPELLAPTELEGFVAEFGDRVYTFLCAYCRNDDLAQEALQNGFLKFIQQVQKGRVRRASAVQYLTTIARNDHLERMRRRSRESELPAEHQDRLPAPEARYEELQRELAQVVLETLADPEVPEEVALVIRLRFLEGAEVDRIVEVTGRSRATVYRLMEKALSILAAACRRAGLGPEDVGL